jgi:hypothetical protein
MRGKLFSYAHPFAWGFAIAILLGPSEGAAHCVTPSEHQILSLALDQTPTLEDGTSDPTEAAKWSQDGRMFADFGATVLDVREDQATVELQR